MNKIYIVHCWDGTKNDGWYPWLDSKLSNDENKVFRFNMPNTENPKIDEWVSELDKQVDMLDENTYFVGHSIGCQTIMRYLQSKDVCKIGGILFVAPWLNLLPEAVSDEESYNTAYPWLNTPIDFEKIKKLTTNINCIFSDDDYFVSLEQKDKFEKLLGAKIVVVSGKGHISQEDDVYELDDILNLSKSMIYCNELSMFVNNNLFKYSININEITDEKKIDCITIFSNSNDDYIEWNNKLFYIGRIVDEMSSGNLFYLNNDITTDYGILNFIKIRKYDSNYDNYNVSIDFIVDDYNTYKNSLDNPLIKKYDTFELIQFKNDKSIINVVSVSAKDDYKL